MSEEILINVTPRETRVALVENGVLQELFIERALRRGLVGNIYRGKVCRVLPGMQAAFVDVGLDRAAFLHASDIESRKSNGEAGANGETSDITRLLHEGQEHDPLFMGIISTFLTEWLTCHVFGVDKDLEKFLLQADVK